MTKRTLTALAGVALLVPGLAFAEVQVINGEAGMIFKDEASTITREDVRAAIGSPIDARGHWQLSGGEAVWKHNDTRYVFEGGVLVHASDCPVLATLNIPAFKGAPGAPLPIYNGA